MSGKLLTTGEAARLCSVTRDTVLKWIRSGKLRARVTAGGHHRIDPDDLDGILASPYRYCWEYNGRPGIHEGCRDCAVYRLRARRCYEAMRILPARDHARLFCKGTCEACDYFRRSRTRLEPG
jgi:excisionase family DNA binding protein